jgi:spore coat protein JB
LQAIDFAIVDTALYLDAYPDCKKALEYYQRLRREREALVESIHAQCGPTTAWNNESNGSWDWVKGPWPWQIEAN